MRTTLFVVTLLLGSASAFAEDAATEGPLRVWHTPPADVQAGSRLALTAAVENDWKLESLHVRWRHPRGGWQTAKFGKGPDGGYLATIPATEVTPPRLEYFLVVWERGQEARVRFASEELPHPVLVLQTEEELRHQDLMSRYQNHTSRARLMADYAIFGRVEAAGGKGYDDRYYQVEVDYLYRLLGPINHIRLGIVSLRGDVPPGVAFGEAAGTEEAATRQRKPGMDYGYSEIALNLGDQAGLYGKLILGADDLGFATGLGGMLRIGPETATRVELGGQAIKRVGFDSFLRLAWDTVPRWPMSLSIHITDTPAGPVIPDTTRTDVGAPHGIRVVYEAGFHATENLTLYLRPSYQARVAKAGGLGFGGGVAVDW